MKPHLDIQISIFEAWDGTKSMLNMLNDENQKKKHEQNPMLQGSFCLLSCLYEYLHYLYESLYFYVIQTQVLFI